MIIIIAANGTTTDCFCEIVEFERHVVVVQEDVRRGQVVVDDAPRVQISQAGDEVLGVGSERT